MKTAPLKLSRYEARREMRFMVKGRSVIVKVGELIPVECLAACNSVQLGRILDPGNRCVRERGLAL